MIEEQQHEYDKAKSAIMRREEKRLASLEEETPEGDVDEEQWAGQNTNRQVTTQSESFDERDLDSEAAHADDDYSIPSTEHRPRLESDSSSVTSISPISGARCSSRSLFVSALSSLSPHQEED